LSTLQRFLSASAASWVKIGFTVLTQLLLVPVILSHWSVEQFGCWLIIQSFGAIIAIVSSGHQIFLGFEFLKAGDRQREEVRTLFYSALPYVFAIAALELLVLVLLIAFGLVDTVFNGKTMDPNLLHQARVSLVLFSVSNLLTATFGGLGGRVVAPFGAFPRFSWWQTLLAVVMALAQGVAVVLGADLLQTVIVVILAGIAVNTPIHIDLWRTFRRVGLHPQAPDWRLGLRNVLHSFLIAVGAVLDMGRAQGVRIFLGALVGVAEMTAFSTMRTLSNLSLQGIGTITNPIMPEIMRFLRERDSERTNATVGFVWFFAVLLLSPVLIAFQWLMPMVFHAWTRGKIQYDPALFGLFSLTLLIYSIARPAAAVLQGNNLLKLQLLISIAVSVIAIAGIFLITPRFGIDGAASALLLGELVGTALNVQFARRWLDANGIEFPWALFGVSLASIGAAAAAIFAIVNWRSATPAIVLVSVALNCLIAILFLRNLPTVAVAKIRNVTGRLLRLAG
jgi:O-antigen/teichoic acid export membrane protein